MNQELRDSIELERARISEQIDSLRVSFEGIVDGTELTSNDDEHDPEGTTIAYERAQVAALLHQAEVDLAALDHALERLSDGTIQTCDVCGGSIPIERLLALPATRLCVNCAS